MFETFWYALPLLVQDVLVFLGLLVPLAVTGIICLAGYRVWPLIAGLLRKHTGISATFVLLIAASVGISVGLIAQERGLREGTARAADKFDLIIAVPGSEITAMLAAVYLQPTALPLLDGANYAKIESHELVDLAAPLAFGDSWEGVPVVGTTPPFVDHLSEGLRAGRVFETMQEAVAGANTPLQVGDVVEPVHGDGSDDFSEHGHPYSFV